MIPPWLIPATPAPEPDQPAFSPPVTLAEHAEWYISHMGWSLCLLRPQSKIPVTTAWNDPSRYIDTVEKALAILAASPECGIGLLHESAHTATWDMDQLDYLRIICEEIGLNLDEMLATYPRIRSRAGRDKLLFTVPADFLGTSKTLLAWPDDSGECLANGQPKMVTVFEFRGGANQDVLPPSIHPDTLKPYTWHPGQAPWDFPDGIPPMPAELLALWKDWPVFQKRLEAICPWRQSPEQLPPPIKRHLSHDGHGDIIGQFNNAVPCHEILERNGYQRKGKRWLCPSSSTKIPGITILEDKVFSHHASDPINNGHAHDAFSLLTILEHGGDINGALRTAARMLGLEFGATIPAMDFTEFLAKSKAKAKAKSNEKPQPAPKSHAPILLGYQFPEHLLNVPGMVGEIADYINKSALFPQPVLAMAASLVFCGALMGRKVRTDTNLRTNIYAISVADSGSGKEHARKAIKYIAQMANASQFIGAEKLASDQGLFVLLSQEPSTAVLMDEFGRTLRVMNNDRAPPHLAQLLTMMMELTGLADSYLKEKRRAEHGPKVQPITIMNPNLCIYATTVPGRLYQGLTPDEVTDGFLPRWLVFESCTPDPELQENRIDDVNPKLIRQIESWVHRPSLAVSEDAPGNADFQVPVIPITPEANDILKHYAGLWRERKQKSRGTGMDSLWARAYEHAYRLALIRGAGHQGVIDVPTIQWACELAEHLLGRMSEQSLANLATNEHESQVQKVQAFIRDKGKTTLSDITRKFRWLAPKDRNSVLGMLKDSDLISVESSSTNGRTLTEIVWTGK